MLVLNVPVFMYMCEADPNKNEFIEGYPLYNNAVAIRGLQNYDALIWIREAGETNNIYTICQRLCTVSFRHRSDNILFAEYKDTNKGITIFCQAIYKDTEMELFKSYYSIKFQAAESLKTGHQYQLVVAFADKQKFDRAVKWFRNGDKRR